LENVNPVWWFSALGGNVVVNLLLFFVLSDIRARLTRLESRAMGPEEYRPKVGKTGGPFVEAG
jgi:hypothetical protein